MSLASTNLLSCLCRLGVLVEVNCETDFVARGDVFQTLAADVAMQLASNSQVEAVSKDDFPQENLEKEREIAMQMEDIQSKPENIRQVLDFQTLL